MDQNVILFDLDGTLTDSAEGIVNSVVYALEHMGIPYESKESLRCFIGPPLQASFGNVFKLSEEQVQDAVRLFRTYFREKGIYENSVYENVPEMLSALRNAGYTLAVATSKPEAFAEQILLRFDLAKYFRVIAGATMDGTDKPTVIREALARLEVKPSSHVLMVGDREHDVLGAREVGIRSLGVLYGYGSEKELSEAGAEYIASTPMEIVSLCHPDKLKAEDARSLFSISVSNLHWMDGSEPTEDLCLHGNATVIIGDEVLQYEDATVSSTALYLLKSIKEDHKIYESNQMLPCCGFFMIANETLSKVDICGCSNGVDWTVLHEKDTVVLTTETGKRIVIPIEEYKQTVFAFADLIENFYKSSDDKKLPEDEFDRNGYIAFWNEWKTLRYKA